MAISQENDLIGGPSDVKALRFALQHGCNSVSDRFCVSISGLTKVGACSALLRVIKVIAHRRCYG
jgi:hypothetical protein